MESNTETNKVLATLGIEERERWKGNETAISA